ncbi:hypothetical protein BC567DRAFT_231476 [Phyllosticta citribraziliensis]
MAAAARDVEHFKSLGNSLLSPPATASPSSPTFERDLKDDAALSPPDAARIAAIQTEVADLKKRFELLKERERFVAMTKEQATHFAEKEGVKVKDICAYDPRLAWSEAEFALWRDSAKGKACFAQGTLNAEPTSADGDLEMTDGGDVAHVNGTAPVESTTNGPSGVKKEDTTDTDTVLDSDGDVDLIKHPTYQPNGVTRDGSHPYPSPTDLLSSTTEPKPPTSTQPASSAPNRAALLRTLLAPPELCPRKRCTRHTQWAKVAHWDVQFELALCRQQMGELSAEEREIRERAAVGWRKEIKRAASAAAAAVPGNDAAPLVNGTGVKEERAPDEEGWVEVLG